MHPSNQAALAGASACFALLDDGGAAQPGSRLYTRLHQHIRSTDASEFAPALAQMQQALAAGRHAVTLFAYELGQELLGIGAAPLRTPLRTPLHASLRTPLHTSLFEILLFEECTILSADEVGQWLQTHAAHAPAGVANIRANVDQAEFSAALAQIHAYIEAGDTYQVNYTWRLRFDAFGDVIDLYTRLRQRQPVPYGALIALPDQRAVLSFSPELFVRHQAGKLTARPMKGTAAASLDQQQDALLAQALAQDPKNRAENLMIVDLLRNDLGQLAQTGSVQVPALFEVQRFGAVLQMTSTVTAQLRAGLDLAQVLSALFPCGSITGAPKRRTMEIIRELEPDARGIYTGAIGWFDAPAAASYDAASAPPAIGDFCLSVPIRTLHLQAPAANGLRPGEMGIGSGIVHDSMANDEYQECRLKARFLTGLAQPFELFETMYATRADGCRDLEAHLQRLVRSSRMFGFDFGSGDGLALPAVRQALLAHLHALPELPADLEQQPLRLKLSLAWPDQIRIETFALPPSPAQVRVRLARRQTPSHDLFLRHKTTLRAEYDQGWQQAEQVGAFDTLFFDADDFLCEGGRSNVFIQLDGHWFTPPLARGILPGIMRARLLRDAHYAATERDLSLADLCRAQQVLLCNSLRGVLQVVIESESESNTWHL
jgi:para-aminobenzoate synthetase/4-amino-4-deoxychorismate lyase